MDTGSGGEGPRKLIACIQGQDTGKPNSKLFRATQGTVGDKHSLRVLAVLWQILSPISCVFVQSCVRALCSGRYTMVFCLLSTRVLNAAFTHTV